MVTSTLCIHSRGLHPFSPVAAPVRRDTAAMHRAIADLLVSPDELGARREHLIGMDGFLPRPWTGPLAGGPKPARPDVASLALSME
ncbi:MAG: hypothetical protein NVV74_01645 [Magnetospirillum sp.]|nr:hypothetical protein [Magnetospirillum sp.]